MKVFSFLHTQGDKRAFHRFRSYCLVRYTTVSQLEPEKAKLTNLKNIGEGGILLTVYEPLHVSSIIKLSINLPGRTLPIESYGKIMHIKKRSPEEEVYHVGVAFLDLPHEDREEIARHIEDIAQQKEGKELLEQRRWWIPWRRTKIRITPEREEKDPASL